MSGTHPKLPTGGFHIRCSSCIVAYMYMYIHTHANIYIYRRDEWHSWHTHTHIHMHTYTYTSVMSGIHATSYLLANFTSIAACQAIWNKKQRPCVSSMFVCVCTCLHIWLVRRSGTRNKGHVPVAYLCMCAHVCIYGVPRLNDPDEKMNTCISNVCACAWCMYVCVCWLLRRLGSTHRDPAWTNRISG
jgi:hypothetical protein